MFEMKEEGINLFNRYLINLWRLNRPISIIISLVSVR